jgi:hypothetical protein
MPLNIYLRQGYASPNDIILRDPTASPQTTVSVGQAVETELAQPISCRKVMTIGQAVESETCQAVLKKKQLGVGQSSETDSAQVITPYLVPVGIYVDVGTAFETETPQAIVASKRVSIGQVSETDVCQVFGKEKTKNLPYVSENDEAGRTILRRKVSTLVANKPILFDAEVSDFVIESLREIFAEKEDGITIEILKGLIVEEETYEYEA